MLVHYLSASLLNGHETDVPCCMEYHNTKLPWVLQEKSIPSRCSAEWNEELCKLSFQVIPVSNFTRAVRRDRGDAVNELVFQASAPPLGYTTYSVSRLPGKEPARSRLLKRLPHQPGADQLSWSIQNEVFTNLTLTFGFGLLWSAWPGLACSFPMRHKPFLENFQGAICFSQGTLYYNFEQQRKQRFPHLIPTNSKWYSAKSWPIAIHGCD